MRPPHLILRPVCDVAASVGAAVAIGAFANAWWHPAAAAPSLLVGAVFGAEAIVHLIWFRPRVIAAMWWLRYEVGPARDALIDLVGQTPSGCPIFDPVDEVVLVCRYDWSSPDVSVTRIRGDDYAALADGTQEFLIVETFHLRARGPEVVSRRVEPWALILDDHYAPVAAKPMLPPEAELDADQERTITENGLRFATSDDVRVLSDQLSRAVP
ncbi:hypothetical protein M8542_36300 [Amycolatopsis sp. OK19-0408]|uniref:Uncharacterized protein n=1 Tax=Amycolatopsis iheyensis TaxID=2945988 RepID=A0A9X2NIB3_9PSEU|nr:hypothetical protein [Amycolatopsis iheyensis]MCR6488307.1 hypothetical protein [Amycolatopsis iheyensis]